MAFLTHQPTTKNVLSKQKFTFAIKKIPNVNWFIQSVILPGANIPPIKRSSPFKKIPVPGDQIEYSPFMIEFKVQEDLQNYLEIWNWLVGIGHPEKLEQYKKLITEDPNSINGNGLYSDASLYINDSQENPIIRVALRNMFPVSLSDIDLTQKISETDFVSATAGFEFLDYDIEAIV